MQPFHESDVIDRTAYFSSFIKTTIMNKVIFFSMVIFLLAGKAIHGQSGSHGYIKGEGGIVKQEISLGPVQGINLGISGDVVLTPGNTQKIVIEGQQNIIDNIRREIKDGTWKIYFVQNVKEAKPVTIYITLPTIEDVSLSGSGSIRSAGKFTGLDGLDIAVAGSGSIHLDFDAKETDLHLSGSGEIKLAGTTKTLDVAISGSGDVHAIDLKSSECDVHISGSGNAKVQVHGDLETHISGSGDVHYTGAASVTARISGSGTVNRMGS